MPPAYVKPYVKRQKNDTTDAEAICEAVTRPQQAAQIAIALLTDTAQLVLAPARVLLRHEPNPGREVPTRSEGFGIGDARD
jgi:transposase